MRALVIPSFAAIVGCAAAPPPEPANPTRTLSIGAAEGSTLDVEPPTVPKMPAPARPAGGFLVDDHVGAHAVSHEAAVKAIAGYDVYGALRVASATKDVVTFDVLNVDGVQRATFSGAAGQIDPASFATGRMFVGAIAIPPTNPNDSTAWVLVPVENESEALTVMMEVASAALAHRAR
jgi:hypothetical protein